MIEIIVIIVLSEKISNIARLKGYVKTGRFVLMFVIFWLAFEFIGAVIGSIIYNNFFVRYLFGLIFAIISAFISFKIINNLKVKELKTVYDQNISINLPFIVHNFRNNLIVFCVIFIITILLMISLNVYLFLIVFPIFFTGYNIYKIIFEENKIIIQYIFGIKKIILKDQIIRTLLTNKLIVELHWKKSTKHSTQTIRFPSNDFLINNIPIENIKVFLNGYIQNNVGTTHNTGVR